MKRRELLTTAAAVGAAWGLSRALSPVKAIAAEAKSIRISAIETFNLELPATPTEVEAGVLNRISVTRVVTESGVKGYSFGGPGGSGGGLQRMRDALTGADLFAVELHLHRGL
jgi:hypothetical protein